ncbi:hypothetical protein A9239_15490 [Methanosarcina sp. A14]|nr:hypothetical protein A9239_15490 [Methanosarcina sp. A14]
MLLCRKEKMYCFNTKAFALMKIFNVFKSWLEKLSSLKNKIFSDEEMHWKLDCIFCVVEKILRRKLLKPVQLQSIINVQTYLWLLHF